MVFLLRVKEIQNSLLTLIHLVVGLLYFLPAISLAGNPPQLLPLEAQWCLKSGVCILLEVADKAEEQKLGMMKREEVPLGQGMWFPYDSSRNLLFWMYKTSVPLDIIFLNKGKVVAIEADAPICLVLPCPSYGPHKLSDGVVELAAGEAKRLDIQIGDLVNIKILKDAE